jgi:hypothetical protein
MYPIGTTLKWVSTKVYEGLENHDEYREAKVTVDGVVQTKDVKIYGLWEDHENDCTCITCDVNHTFGTEGTVFGGKKLIFKDFISWLKSLPPGKITITVELDV